MQYRVSIINYSGKPEYNFHSKMISTYKSILYHNNLACNVYATKRIITPPQY